VARQVGIDIVEVSEVEEALRAQPDRYLRRVFTQAEVAGSADAGGSADPRRLAALFAAKEATMKALGVAEEAVPWSSIEVCPLPGRRASLQLSGAAESLARARGVRALATSLTQTQSYGAAVVIAITGDRN
jgi:holo-[acyl-carrier protein] synthase